jgi:hypothetical protein
MPKKRNPIDVQTAQTQEREDTLQECGSRRYLKPYIIFSKVSIHEGRLV